MTKQETATAAAASIEDAAECGERADALVIEVLGRMMRQRRSIAAALDYVKSLSRGTRANCWELAEAAGHETPHRMQALLRRYKWSWEKLRALLPGLAAECLPDDPDDLIGPGIAVDETAHLKKGRSTACVSPQHAGVTGKVENCVTWVFTALVTVFGQAWIDFGVYMPECWAKDPPHREKAGIPEDLTFATKPELAAEQIKRLMAAGVRALWAAADEVYGRCGEFRDTLRALSLAYVVIIPCDYRVTLAKDKVIRADEAIAGAVFERRSCGNGEKGPRYSDWALTATADPREFLLIRCAPAVQATGERGAGNNGPVSTATASSFLNGPGVRGGTGWPLAWPERVVGVAGPLADLAALVSLGLPGIPGPLQLRGRGSGQPPAGAEGPELQVRLGQPPPALGPRAGQHRGGVQILDPPGPGELVHVGGDAIDDRPHLCEVDGHDGPARPVGGRAQVDRWRVAISVQVREPVRALPQPAHLIG